MQKLADLVAAGALMPPASAILAIQIGTFSIYLNT